MEGTMPIRFAAKDVSETRITTEWQTSAAQREAMYAARRVLAVR